MHSLTAATIQLLTRRSGAGQKIIKRESQSVPMMIPSCYAACIEHGIEHAVGTTRLIAKALQSWPAACEDTAPRVKARTVRLQDACMLNPMSLRDPSGVSL